MPTNEILNHTKARLARAHRTYGANSPEVAEARRDFNAAKLETYVVRVVGEAPDLTPAQRDRIAALLRPADGGRVA